MIDLDWPRRHTRQAFAFVCTSLHAALSSNAAYFPCSHLAFRSRHLCMPKATAWTILSGIIFSGMPPRSWIAMDAFSIWIDTR